MRTIFFLLLFGLGTANAQTYTIKVSDLDSLLWMAQKYKAADSALNSATASIQALRDAISKNADVVTLQWDQIENYKILVDNLKATIANDRELALIERAELRTKFKKKNRQLFGLSGLSLILLAALLL